MKQEIGFRFVYITTRSKRQALDIGRDLIDARLAACVNILDGMTSLYRWEGKVEHSDEVIVIAKTIDSHVNTLVEHVKNLHSDDCPCIISLPVAAEEGNRDFLEWIRTETA